MRTSRICRRCLQLLSAAVFCSFVVIVFYTANDGRLSLERSHHHHGRPRQSAPWPPLNIEDQYAGGGGEGVAAAGGGSSFENRWNKYSIVDSIRRKAIERLNALRPMNDDGAPNFVMFRQRPSARPHVTHHVLDQPGANGSTPVPVEPLMSPERSGADNERIRRTLLRVEGDDRWSSGDSSIWWFSSERRTTTSDSDRILAQMAHVPTNYRLLRMKNQPAKIKSIYVEGGFGGAPMGRTVFDAEGCPVDACRLTSSPNELTSADMILFQAGSSLSTVVKSPGQIWAIYMLESPANNGWLYEAKNVINWTATYRWDSTIVTPYAKFRRYPKRIEISSPKRNYASGKTKKVAWFVSNCYARNERLAYLEELSKYITVDVYGACGSLNCPRSNDTCMKLLSKDYKFYLSFENSNCDYYITEKLFENALLNDVVPVVMGARLSDYSIAVPPHSFIHVQQFPSAADLAKYLHRLDQNDDLYNAYFAWKGSGEFINTKFWCRVCALLHDDSKPNMWYTDLSAWWTHNGACRVNRWN